MLLLVSSLVLAEPQLKVRAALVLESAPGLPGAVVSTTRQDVRALLEGSGRYLMVDEMVVQARTGMASQELATHCGAQAQCWSQTTTELAADQLIHLSLSGDAQHTVAELVVWDAGNPEPRRYLSVLPRGGGAPMEVLEQAFFASGSLVVQAPVGVRMSLDGESLGEVGGLLSLPIVEGGKHTLGMLDAQGGQHLLVVQVVPGVETLVDFVPPPPVLTRRRWGRWASLGLVAGAAAVFVTTAQSPGTVARP